MARSSYWIVVSESRERYGLTLDEAREFYRRFASYLGDVGLRPYKAFGVDLDRHPRIAFAVAQSIIDEREEEDRFEEWEITVRYPRSDEAGGGELMVQVRVLAPAGLTRRQVLAAILPTIMVEKRVPRGYFLEAIDWKSVKPHRGRRTVGVSEGSAEREEMFEALRKMRFALRHHSVAVGKRKR